MPLVYIFVMKSQFGPSIIFISIWSLFWKFDLNIVISVSGTIIALMWCHVSVPPFFEFFKKVKNCHVSSFHRAMWQ